MGDWSRMWRKPTTYLVIVFVAIFLWGMSREARADVNAVVGLGMGTTHSSTIRAQEVLLEFDRNWTVGVAHLGNEPRIKNTWVAHATYRVDWREEKRVAPFAQFGIAYFEHSPDTFVSEELTYNLSVGVRLWGVVDAVWVHHSTAGRAYENRGLDYAALRAVLPLRGGLK